MCSAGACVNTCASIARCPDGVCQSGACVPIFGDGGVRPTDAGLDATLDAGTCHGPACDPVVHLTVRDARAYAVTAGGHAWAWGLATNYVLGDGLIAHGTCAMCSPTPVEVLDSTGAPLANVVAVAASEATACALLADTSVRCWGYGSEGQLGSPSGGSPVPTPVLDASGVAISAVTALAAGRSHFCVIRGAAREVWCWGQGGGGQLGRGDTMDSDFAAPASTFTGRASALALSNTHTIVLRDDATAVGFGDDDCGCLGVGLAGLPVTPPALLPVASIASVATTSWNTCALATDGSVSCWGFGTAALGTSYLSATQQCMNCPSTAATHNCSPAPFVVALPTGVAFEHISGSAESIFFGYTRAHDLYAWGSSYMSPIDRIATPLRISASATAPMVEAGASAQVCLLDALGDVFCAGPNQNGELGRGSVASSAVSDGRFLPVVWP